MACSVRKRPGAARGEMTNERCKFGGCSNVAGQRRETAMPKCSAFPRGPRGGRLPAARARASLGADRSAVGRGAGVRGGVDAGHSGCRSSGS
jgi:hypothetical protein